MTQMRFLFLSSPRSSTVENLDSLSANHTHCLNLQNTHPLSPFLFWALLESGDIVSGGHFSFGQIARAFHILG